MKWGVIGIILIFFMIILGYFSYIYLPLFWMIILGLMFAFLLVLGLATGDIRGVLIDDRNQMSLSRFQLVSWTLIIISAYFTLSLSRVHELYNSPDLVSAMIIAVPWEIWTLLGIGTTALVGTNLILGDKKGKNYKKEENNEDPYINLNKEGVVCKNLSSKGAKLTDIFIGDELAECSNLNLAKIQMFFFTILILIAYSVLLLQLMSANSPKDINSFPPLSQDLVILLGISNGGYLLQKAAPSTPT